MGEPTDLTVISPQISNKPFLCSFDDTRPPFTGVITQQILHRCQCVGDDMQATPPIQVVKLRYRMSVCVLYQLYSIGVGCWVGWYRM